MAKIIIENFMTSELGLSGNQLVLYAHLWAESKQGTQTVGDDYAKYSAAINVTIPTYYSTRNSLTARGLVYKHDGQLYVRRTSLNEKS